MNKEAEERSFEMGKWTIHCALFDVIMQLCHVIHFLDGSPFCVCEEKNTWLCPFFIPIVNHQKNSPTKRAVFFHLTKANAVGIFSK